MRVRSQKAEAKREEILQAALKIFHRKSYHGTSMQDIADAVGMYKGSLYHHIDNKEQVLLEIVRKELDEIIEGLEQTCAGASRFEDKLRSAIQHHIRHTVLHTDFLAVLLENTQHLSEEYRKPIVAQQHRYEKIFIDILENGIRSGDCHPVDVKVVAFGILGMCNWVYRWYSNEGPRTSDEIAVAFFQVLMSGLKRDKDVAEPQIGSKAVRS